MRRLLKFTVLLCVLLFTFSLLGCASNDNSHKEAKDEVNTKAVAKQSVQTKVAKAETNKGQTTEQATESASAETKEKNPEQIAPQTNTNSQNSNKNQANSFTNQANTSTNTSSNQSTAPVTTKPATATTPSTTPPIPKPAENVTFSIVGPKERGTIIGASKVSFKDGETILDVLLNETKKNNIVVDSRGSGATAYVEGIDNIYEFDYGAKSGWVFKLNGVSLTKSVGMIKVKDGDRIECYYTE